MGRRPAVDVHRHSLLTGASLDFWQGPGQYCALTQHIASRKSEPSLFVGKIQVTNWLLTPDKGLGGPRLTGYSHSHDPIF